MPDESTPCHGTMEGKGAYNQHARLQAGGASLALPLLEKAARSVPLDSGDQTLFIADYGSAQGKNSLAPMGMAIRAFRERVGPDRAIMVFHVDQPTNDYNTLFEVLHSAAESYTLNDSRVFPCAIGRSFYGNVLPPESVRLGWSSYAAVWLSQIPMPIPGHFIALGSTGAVRAAFDRQGAQDWEAFLTVRASELHPGGRLVIVLPALNDDGVSGFEDLCEHLNAALAEMVDEGALYPEDRARIVLGSYPRRRSDLLAPFPHGRPFQHLVVEACELFALEDPAWVDYQSNPDKDRLASRQAAFVRSTFMPSLAQGLRLAHEAEVRRAFMDRLETGLRRRLAGRPAAVHSFVQTMVLAKQRSD